MPSKLNEIRTNSLKNKEEVEPCPALFRVGKTCVDLLCPAQLSSPTRPAGSCQAAVNRPSQLGLPSGLPSWLLVTSLQSVDSCHLSFLLAPPLGSLSCLSSDAENRLCQIAWELLLSPVCNNHNHDLGSVTLAMRCL